MEAREDVTAVELKNSPEVREIKNGPLKALTRTPSPRKVPETPRAAQAANIAADAAHANPCQCTLILPEQHFSSALFSAVGAAAPSSAAADRLPGTSAPVAQAQAENHTEINPMERVQVAAPDDHGGGGGADLSPQPVEAEACGQVPGITEVLSRPNTPLPPDVMVKEEGQISLSR